MIRHIVLMRFEDKTAIEPAAKALRSLKGSSPLLLDIDVGVNVSNAETAYDLAFCTAFACAEDQKAFNSVPPHVEVRQFLSQFKKTSVKVDYIV